jgi:hypothetical protein
MQEEVWLAKMSHPQLMPMGRLQQPVLLLMNLGFHPLLQSESVLKKPDKQLLKLLKLASMLQKTFFSSLPSIIFMLFFLVRI